MVGFHSTGQADKYRPKDIVIHLRFRNNHAPEISKRKVRGIFG